MGRAVAGFVAFTELTDPGAHRAYNAWHQLDHLPEQLPLPGVVAGTRWVATPACRAARRVVDEALDPADYCTLYLLADPLAETVEQFFARAANLRAEGRFFAERRAVLSGLVDLEDVAVAPRVAVSAEAVPHRPHAGVVVVVEEFAGTGGGDGLALPWTAWSPARVVELDGVAGAWSFRASAKVARAAPHRAVRITVCWCDGDPVDVAEDLGPALAAAAADGPGPDGARLVHAGPFETITPYRWDWFDPPAP